MSDILILDLDDYKKWTAISKNMGGRALDYATRTGQLKYLIPVLGKDLYDTVLVEVSGVSPTPPYDVLIEDYIKPFLSIVCYRDIMADGVVISSATGAKSITDNTNNATEVNQNALGIALKKFEQDSNNFKQFLIDYLEDNLASFPDYESKCSAVNTNSGVSFMQVKRRYKY